MTEIRVTAREGGDGWTCDVEVGEDSAIRDEVTVLRADLERLAPGGSVEDLVRRSFDGGAGGRRPRPSPPGLGNLPREPMESILRRFDLPVIGRYFPEYERTIRRAAS